MKRAFLCHGRVNCWWCREIMGSRVKGSDISGPRVTGLHEENIVVKESVML
jgi:hypothetical protein